MIHTIYFVIVDIVVVIGIVGIVGSKNTKNTEYHSIYVGIVDEQRKHRIYNAWHIPVLGVGTSGTVDYVLSFLKDTTFRGCLNG